ncbi:related to acyl-coenzyme A oxidase 1 [Melanopsichium pennsylvanicum]|uniref:Acyl-coenzyme A oxidase n=2 Tax=Melanopsichium pennsylvanicum TaxID=63383 RepID=A0AAJ5C8U0_9BASI|nr:related to acyl-coenzyme A oxidase 1, peroxisomal [Melanopsichium pennsylvanicum 4]SNX88033.1 related to acyl-coenzyme A oxidase 1 [Melanopsichium pennsylvanicum]
MASTRPAPETIQPRDIQQERASCSFNIDAMSCIIPGSKAERDNARWLLSLLKNDPDHTFDKEDRVFQSRNDRFLKGQKIALRYFEIRNEHGLEKKDADMLRLFTDEYLPIQVAESMAQPTLMRQASQQQWAEWGPMVRSGRWLGCYMQTELAHGSNLSAMRTTATLDMQKDEWIINTPEPSAGKVWIGGSGLTATYGIVMANLIVKNKSYGMHPFLVHLRSLKDHSLLPNRRIMEMGCKLGAPAMDNGYICFDSVRIPRTNLLQRFQTVSRQGVYEKRNAAAQVMTRGTMTLVRVGLCEIAAHHLARAATIAIRYAVVRRQGTSATKHDQLEPKILDYASVQTRVLTALASAYAITFVSQHLRRMYNKMIAEIESTGNSGLLPIVHGHSSVLKAVCTNESLAGIERCRRSMGGHGFSQASGFDFERNQPNAGLIYEGDNSMLLAGPSANFLVKQLNETRKHNGKAAHPELAYLELISKASSASKAIPKRAQAIGLAEIEEPAVLLDLLGYRAALLVDRLATQRSANQNTDGVSKHIDTNLAVRASNAHGAYLVAFAFSSLVHQLKTSSPGKLQSCFGVTVTAAHITALDHLLCFYLLQNCILSQDTLSDFLELDLFTGAQLDKLRYTSAKLLAGPIRTDALGLVESFDMDDWYLCSPLGSSDGRAYERMIEWMKREPLNHTGEMGARDENGVVKGYHDGIGRLIRGEAVQFTEKPKL